MGGWGGPDPLPDPHPPLWTPPGSHTPRTFAALLDTALERLRALPGVEAVSLASAVPLDPFLALSQTGALLRPDGGSRAVRVRYNSNAVGPDYFRIMGIPMLEGRAFADSDRAGAPEVVILNQNLARRLFGSADPVGRLTGFMPSAGLCRVKWGCVAVAGGAPR